VRGEPPFCAGAVQESATWVFPKVGVRPVGAPGTVAGVALRILDGVEVPTPFCATISKS
jgi:hypothetical protein